MPAITGMVVFYMLSVFLISRIIKKKDVRLSITEISLIFGCKVLLGCLYGYIFLHYYNGDDTWAYNYESIGEYNKLIHSPLQFLKDFSPASAFGATSDVWKGARYYMNDLEYWSILKLLALFDVVSRGNYYINIVLFNFILFWGHYWLFALLVKLFSDKRRPLLIAIFFVPPFIFWLSGIRADGLLLFFLALVLRHFYRWLYERKSISLLYCIAGMTGLFIFRSLWLFALVPVLTAWVLIVRFNKRPLLAFIAVYGILLTLFFASALLSPQKNLPNLIVQRQQEFMQLKGNTVFALDRLEPGLMSFVRVLPQAISHTFLRPYIWEAKGLLQILSAIEVIFFWVLVITAILKRDPRWKAYLTHPVLLACCFYAISLNILIGYMVPFPGAIERYRVIPMLLLCIMAVIMIKWEKTINKIFF